MELSQMLHQTISSTDSLDLGWRWAAGMVDEEQVLKELLNCSPKLFLHCTMVDGEYELSVHHRKTLKDWDYRFFDKYGTFPR